MRILIDINHPAHVHLLRNVYYELLKKNFIGSTSNPLIKRECIDRVGC